MNSPHESKLAIYAGTGLICASLLLAASSTQIPIWLAILVGALIGTPLIFLGFRLRTEAARVESPGSSFLPTKEDQRRIGWGIVAVSTFIVLASAPFVVLSPLLLLPSGDRWPLVAARLTLVAIFVLAFRWWVKPATRIFHQLFRGKVTAGFLDCFQEQPTPEPINVRTAVTQNWQLAAVAAAAFLVVFGILDMKSPWLELDFGPRRYHRLALVLEWCRGNLNTVKSSSFLIGVGSIAMYIYRIRRAWLGRTTAAARVASPTNDEPSAAAAPPEA